MIKDIVYEILGEASNLIERRLRENGIPFDNNTGDTIYIDDAEVRKTYYINTPALNECEDYGGED